jgi:predicted metal-dependent phosphoesterase TrpH
VSQLRLDLHNHTSFSADGLLSPDELLKSAKARGIDCIAVTDHNTVEGALAAQRLSMSDASLPSVIPGVELATRDGEVVGLYVDRDIPRDLSLQEAVDRIRSLGGIAYLPHPHDVLRRGAVSRGMRLSAAQMCDLVEVVNGRALGPRSGSKSAWLAQRCGKPGGAGSDAHRALEVGRAHVVVRELPVRETLIEVVSAGHVEHNLRAWSYAFNWILMASSPLTRLWRGVTGSLPPR